MTDNADFKKLVRQRMELTRESYTIARMQLLAQRRGASVPQAARGGMPSPPPLLAPPLLDVYAAGVADLGVTEIRHTRNAKEEIEGLYFVVPGDTSYHQEKGLVQRLRERWSAVGVELVVVRQRADGGFVAWSWKEEDAELRWEAAQRSVRVVHEGDGRWAARTDTGRVEYGLSEGDARARLLHELWDDENAWQNQVDDDTREYIELQDDD